MNTGHDLIPPDYRFILDLVEPRSSVLDLGCGDGKLLQLLVRERRIRGQGIEIDDRAIFACVAKGLSVLHEDIDYGLPEFTDDSFDYVILNQSFQQVKKPDEVLTEALRVGRRVIIGFPNFAYWNARFQIFFKGITPVTHSLPYAWHDTPNLHFLSIRDFLEYCVERDIDIEASAYLAGKRKISHFPNLLAEAGIMLLAKRKPAGDAAAAGDTSTGNIKRPPSESWVGG